TATSLAIEQSDAPARNSSPTGLQKAGGSDPRRASADAVLVAAEVLSRRLAEWVEADPRSILFAWRDRDALRGREVSWEGGSGIADGVDDRGYLLVVGPGGDRLAVGAGEVHLRVG
ncbi:MAG: hypothetical protein ACM3NV_04315, partial [Syntrophothermus sp.]